MRATLDYALVFNAGSSSLKFCVYQRPLEAGNMMAKMLSFLANADSAGLVLGARVPVILTSRADSVMTRLASCAVASLFAHARREALSRAVQ